MWEAARQLAITHPLHTFLLGALFGAIIKELGIDIYKWLKIMLLTLFRYLRGFHRASLKQMNTKTSKRRGTDSSWKTGAK